jgi:hypothetical protein
MAIDGLKINKYGATRTNGYASKKEFMRATELKMLEKAGIISELKEQVVFILAPSVIIQGRKRPPLKYVADFEYMDGTSLVVEDVKGVITDVYRVKRHLMKSVHGIDILET